MDRPNRRPRALLAAWVTLVTRVTLVTLVTFAQGAAAMEPLALSRQDAIARGADYGPSIAVEAAPRSAAAAAARAANPLVIFPPRLTIDGGQRFGAFGSGIEARVQVLQDIPVRRVGRERERAADLLRRSTEANVAQARLDAAARAGIAWVGVSEAQQALELRKQSLADADELLRLARVRVQSGAGQPLELQQALGERGAANALLLDAEGRLVEACAELRFAAGLDPSLPLVASGDLFAISDAAIDEAAAIRRASASHAALQASQRRAEVARQEERVIGASRAPVVSVGAAYLHEGTADQVWTALLSVPLPLGDFGAFDRARQRAVADQAEAQIALTQKELARDVRMALHERLHAREVLGALRTGARAPLGEALRLARVQYQAGTSELSVVVLARQRFLAAEEQIVRAAADVQRADLRLLRAAGTLLESPSTGGAP